MLFPLLCCMITAKEEGEIMGLWLFLGGFCAAAAGIAVVYQVLRRKVRSASRQIFGTEDVISLMKEIDAEAENTPRSLNGCDSLLLPKILKDFPDFDVTLAKTYAKNALKEKFGSKDGFTIYQVVIARYLPSAVQKTIVFQAAVSWRDGGKLQQKRYDLYDTYLLSGGSDSVAANCPNCGGALGYGETVCSFCGSRVANVLGNVWEFTEIKES